MQLDHHVCYRIQLILAVLVYKYCQFYPVNFVPFPHLCEHNFKMDVFGVYNTTKLTILALEVDIYIYIYLEINMIMFPTLTSVDWMPPFCTIVCFVKKISYIVLNITKQLKNY